MNVTTEGSFAGQGTPNRSLMDSELKVDSEKKVESTMTQMVFSRHFVVLYTMNFLSIASGYFAVNNFKKYGQLNGITNENFLAIVGSIAAVCNSIRFVWSFMTDYLSYKLVYAILLIMQIVLNFTIPLISSN